uniref:Origin recognition complex subunit 5 n=1 Tax=Eptatretus burgeri TaxID=7764 RepID=A0A8C4Q873_EPTBU
MDPAAGELLDRLRADFPCREGQLKTLLGLLGQANHCCFHSLFIYGHPATGKTTVTLAILQALQIPHVFLNCVECFTPRLLFEHILASMSSLGEHGSTTENLPRCDNLSEFSRMLHQKLQQLQLHESNVYIVLDKAEYLKNLDFKILAVFTRLQELTNCRVAAVLISELVWATFYSGTGCIEPLMLHFPQYNKAELQVILTKDFPNSYSSKFYANFVSILLSVFLPVSRDLRELQHLAALNFSKYCEPIEKGQIREDESNKLWRNIEPHLKKAMKTIYLQEVSSLQWEKWQKEGCTMPIKDFSAPVCLELPFYSKFLLIAAYLAAYNPARTDSRFFLKVFTFTPII